LRVLRHKWFRRGVGLLLCLGVLGLVAILLWRWHQSRPIRIGDEQLHVLELRRDHDVLFYFMPDCEPCRQIAPLVDAYAARHPDARVGRYDATRLVDMKRREAEQAGMTGYDPARELPVLWFDGRLVLNADEMKAVLAR
jgi:thiol-disulfide isomerase/thioredoxin